MELIYQFLSQYLFPKPFKPIICKKKAEIVGTGYRGNHELNNVRLSS